MEWGFEEIGVLGELADAGEGVTLVVVVGEAGMCRESALWGGPTGFGGRFPPGAVALAGETPGALVEMGGMLFFFLCPPSFSESSSREGSSGLLDLI